MVWTVPQKARSFFCVFSAIVLVGVSIPFFQESSCKLTPVFLPSQGVGHPFQVKFQTKFICKMSLFLLINGSPWCLIRLHLEPYPCFMEESSWWVRTGERQKIQEMFSLYQFCPHHLPPQPILGLHDHLIAQNMFIFLFQDIKGILQRYDGHLNCVLPLSHSWFYTEHNFRHPAYQEPFSSWEFALRGLGCRRKGLNWTNELTVIGLSSSPHLPGPPAGLLLSWLPAGPPSLTHCFSALPSMSNWP